MCAERLQHDRTCPYRTHAPECLIPFFKLAYDGSELKIYINGELEATAAYSGAAGTSGLDLWIGADDLPSFFPGVIDEIRMYDTALDEANIRRIMDEAASVQPGDKLPVSWGIIKAVR